MQPEHSITKAFSTIRGKMEIQVPEQVHLTLLMFGYDQGGFLHFGFTFGTDLLFLLSRWNYLLFFLFQLFNYLLLLIRILLDSFYIVLRRLFLFVLYQTIEYFYHLHKFRHLLIVNLKIIFLLEFGEVLVIVKHFILPPTPLGHADRLRPHLSIGLLQAAHLLLVFWSGFKSIHSRLRQGTNFLNDFVSILIAKLENAESEILLLISLVYVGFVLH